MYGHFDVGAVAAQAPPSSSTSGGSGGVSGSSAAGKTAIRTVATLLTRGRIDRQAEPHPRRKTGQIARPGQLQDRRGGLLAEVRRLAPPGGGPLTTLTAAAFVGKRTVTTRLTTGTWTLSSPPAKAIVFRVAAT